LLARAALLLAVFWVFVFFMAEFETPASALIVRPEIEKNVQGQAVVHRRLAARKLQ
jgi:hypothetical protein